MAEPGTEANPLRVAVIGSGPSGFYVVDHLFKQKERAVEVDLYDRLPTPFGLVRGGVAPDHQKIKSVTKAYDRIAANPNFRFYGYVEFGTDVRLEDLKELYHVVVFTTGAQTDLSMGIPGEDLEGSHAATEFVAWYNGHPDYRDRQFDLSQERVAIVGVGNVAVDVTRILCRSKEELAKTDIADYALEALSRSRVKEVYMLGRRGPAQAAFTNPEIKELGEMEDADIWVPPEEAELDALSKEVIEKSQDKAAMKKVKILQEYAARKPTGKSRRLIVRFLVSPVEIHGDEAGRVRGVRLVKNQLYLSEKGVPRPRPTDQFEELPLGLLFRSVGYRGVPLPGVPFHDKWGIVPNEKGRVMDPDTQKPVLGLYVAGWIKRGATGVIGTNKPDALETVSSVMEDLAKGWTLRPSRPQAGAAEELVRRRKPNFFSYQDWLRLNEIEVARARESQRPRVKFTRIEEMLAALGRSA
ncbi:MAG: NADP oxidoreductase [Acidobacteriota bacterium]